jgi:ABC-2 type transport system ATP-binding protein
MIEVKNIAKSYGKKKPVLRDISFTAKQGECIAIAGANGCGKSTLLSILAGTLRPDAGEFCAFGHNMFKEPKERERTIGYVPQENPLIPELTARDNLRLWYCDSPFDMDEELENGVLAMLGIGEFLNVRVSAMSGGMKKRLAIASVLLSKPDILLLDEPLAALDIPAKNDIIKFIDSFRAKGGTVFIASHSEEMFKHCSKIYLLKNGVSTLLPSGISPAEALG